VIVAVIAVRMVQMAVHEVVDVVAVRHRFVAAAGAMDVTLRMAAAVVLGRTVGRVLLGHIDGVLLHLASFRVVQVAVVQIIDVVAVLDRGVAAAFAVVVIVIVMMLTHRLAPCFAMERPYLIIGVPRRRFHSKTNG
jgi:hypothetical protein